MGCFVLQEDLNTGGKISLAQYSMMMAFSYSISSWQRDWRRDHRGRVVFSGPDRRSLEYGFDEQHHGHFAGLRVYRFGRVVSCR